MTNPEQVDSPMTKHLPIISNLTIVPSGGSFTSSGSTEGRRRHMLRLWWRTRAVVELLGQVLHPFRFVWVSYHAGSSYSIGPNGIQ